jgi:hypothetical protein
MNTMSVNIQEAVRKGRDIINFLLKQKLSTLSYAEKQIIRNSNKPCPDVVNLVFKISLKKVDYFSLILVLEVSCQQLFLTAWF